MAAFRSLNVVLVCPPLELCVSFCESSQWFASTGEIPDVSGEVSYHLEEGYEFLFGSWWSTVLDSLNLGWARFEAFLYKQVSVEVNGCSPKLAFFTSQGEVVVLQSL